MEKQAQSKQRFYLEQFVELKEYFIKHKMGKNIGENGLEVSSLTGKKTLTITALIHGNEPGGLLLINDILGLIKVSGYLPNLNLRVVLGNLKAFKENKRFLNNDLNRCFNCLDENKTDENSYEEEIAKFIKEMVRGSDYLIDLHQTQGPTESDFFIFPHTSKNISFAKKLGLACPLILHDLEFSEDGDTVDTWASKEGIAAITYEMGEKGFRPDQIIDIKNALAVFLGIGRSLEDFIGIPCPQKGSNILTWGETLMNSPGLELVSDLKNFSPIKKGDLLAIDKVKNEKVFASCSGPVLFPKYGENAQNSSELCRILKSCTINN